MHPASIYGKVYVLRIGHRPERDKRITTHVGLVARAFGANGFILGDVCDDSVITSLKKTLETWGGSMHVECGVDSKSYVESWKLSNGEVIHLTMYGLSVEDVIDQIRSSLRPKLIIVGAEKVEGFYYEKADYNIAIGHQPHSEVSALAIFLDRLYRGGWAYIEFERAKLKIIPSSRSKRVLRL